MIHGPVSIDLSYNMELRYVYQSVIKYSPFSPLILLRRFVTLVCIFGEHNMGTSAQAFMRLGLQPEIKGFFSL